MVSVSMDGSNGERGTPVAEIADFLCRSEQEVREKIPDLGWSQRGLND
jgi:hypothetical protein